MFIWEITNDYYYRSGSGGTANSYGSFTASGYRINRNNGIITADEQSIGTVSSTIKTMVGDCKAIKLKCENTFEPIPFNDLISWNKEGIAIIRGEKYSVYGNGHQYNGVEYQIAGIDLEDLKTGVKFSLLKNHRLVGNNCTLYESNTDL